MISDEKYRNHSVCLQGYGHPITGNTQVTVMTWLILLTSNSFGQTALPGCGNDEEKLQAKIKYQHRTNTRPRGEGGKNSEWMGGKTGKQTKRRSVGAILKKEQVTKRKVMAIIGAIRHGTVWGADVMCHPSTEQVALWEADDKTVWSHAR